MGSTRDWSWLLEVGVAVVSYLGSSSSWRSWHAKDMAACKKRLAHGPGSAYTMVVCSSLSRCVTDQTWPWAGSGRYNLARARRKRRQGLAPHILCPRVKFRTSVKFRKKIPHASWRVKMNRAVQQCSRPPLVGCHLPRSRIFGSSPSPHRARNLVVTPSPMPTSWRLMPFPRMGHLGPKHRSPECARDRTWRM